MSDEPDELAAGLRELAEHEAPAADERFEAGLRQAMCWEQRRRRTQRRWLVAVGCLSAVFVALVVALALPASARLLPLPVGGELRSLDAQAGDLQARLSAQAATWAELRRGLAARSAVADRGSLVARSAKATGKSAGAYAPNVWSSGWAYVRPTASPNPSVARPAGVPTLAASPSPQSPSSTPTPTSTPTPIPTPTSP
jgi:hypothetical protein